MENFKVNDKVMCVEEFNCKNAPKIMDVFIVEESRVVNGINCIALNEVFNIYSDHKKVDFWFSEYFVKISEIQYNKYIRENKNNFNNLLSNLM